MIYNNITLEPKYLWRMLIISCAMYDEVSFPSLKKHYTIFINIVNLHLLINISL